MPDFAALRKNMVLNQLRPNRIDDPRVIEAMLEVPRERFVPESLRGVAYGDDDLDLGHGRRLIEPLALGKLLQAAAIAPADRVMVIGCDTGYVAAVLARLAASVVLVLPAGIDQRGIESRLSELGGPAVTIRSGSPIAGLADGARFDVILLAGSVAELPQPLLAQLADDGRLAAVVQHGSAGHVTVARRIEDAFGTITPFDAALPELAEFRPPPAFKF